MSGVGVFCSDWVVDMKWEICGFVRGADIVGVEIMRRVGGSEGG